MPCLRLRGRTRELSVFPGQAVNNHITQTASVRDLKPLRSCWGTQRLLPPRRPGGVPGPPHGGQAGLQLALLLALKSSLVIAINIASLLFQEEILSSRVEERCH